MSEPAHPPLSTDESSGMSAARLHEAAGQRKFGTLLSYVSIFIHILAGLLVTPIMVHHLGKSQLGVYNIVGSFIAYLAILDLGLSDSVVRYVAKYRAINDHRSEENFLAFIFLAYTLISIVMVGAGLVILHAMGGIFGKHMTHDELSLARLMFAVLLVNVTATVLFNAITSTIVAYERFILLRSLEILSSLSTNVGVVFVLLYGYKVHGFQAAAVVAVITTVNMLMIVFKICYAFFALKIKLRLHHLDPAFVKDIAKFASAIFVVVIVEQIYWKLDNIILGAMLQPAIVAVYAIGMSFSKYFMSFSTAVSKVMMPKIVRRVELGASGTELTDMLITTSRVQAIILMLILSGLVVLGREFIYLWVGPDFWYSYYIMLVSCIPFSLDLMGNIRNSIMQAKGIYWYRSITIFILSLINIAGTILLTLVWGMIGAAVSTGAGIFIGYVITNFILSRKAGMQMIRYHRELASGIVPAVLCTSVVGIVLSHVYPLAAQTPHRPAAAMHAKLPIVLGTNPATPGVIPGASPVTPVASPVAPVAASATPGSLSAKPVVTSGMAPGARVQATPGLKSAGSSKNSRKPRRHRPWRLWGIFLIKVLVFAVSYAVFMWNIGLRVSEKKLIRSLFPKIRLARH